MQPSSDAPKEEIHDPLLDELTSIIRSAAKLPASTEITIYSSLLDDLKIDSLDLFGILTAVMDRYEMEIRPDELPPISTVSDLMSFVRTNSQVIQSPQPSLVEPLEIPELIAPKSLIDKTMAPMSITVTEKAPQWSFLRRLQFGLCRKLPASVARRFSYQNGHNLLSLFSKAPGLRQLLYRKQLADLHLFLEVSGRSTRKERTAIESLSVLSNHGLIWHLERLANMEEQGWSRWVQIQGFENFQSVFKTGKGVVLLMAHLPLMMLTLKYLNKCGYSRLALVGLAEEHLDVMKLGALKRSLLSDESIWKRAEGIRFAAQLTNSKTLLEQGGVAMIAADGQMGSRQVSVPFWGRNRPFGIGFAELALATKAAVVPVFTELDSSGRVCIRFLQPLSTPAGTHTEQVQSYVLQYADLLAEAWSKRPGNIHWHSLGKFARNYEA